MDWASKCWVHLLKRNFSPRTECNFPRDGDLTAGMEKPCLGLQFACKAWISAQNSFLFENEFVFHTIIFKERGISSSFIPTFIMKFSNIQTEYYGHQLRNPLIYYCTCFVTYLSLYICILLATNKPTVLCISKCRHQNISP